MRCRRPRSAGATRSKLGLFRTPRVLIAARHTAGRRDGSSGKIRHAREVHPARADGRCRSSVGRERSPPHVLLLPRHPTFVAVAAVEAPSPALTSVAAESSSRPATPPESASQFPPITATTPTFAPATPTATAIPAAPSSDARQEVRHRYHDIPPRCSCLGGDCLPLHHPHLPIQAGFFRRLPGARAE